MARLGLNCTLSYQQGSAVRQYRVRAGDISHGVQMIASESVARTQRAYYPHRTAESQFAVVILLKNWDERSDFTSWMATYGEYAVDPDIAQSIFPWMTVTIPSRDFSKQGVPLAGYQWGAHTGQMMFTPQVVFEAASSPGQHAGLPDVSSVINKWSAFGQDQAIQYFYPIGTQLAGDQKGTYQGINYPGDPGQFNPPPPPPPPVLPPGQGPSPTV